MRYDNLTETYLQMFINVHLLIHLAAIYVISQFQ